MSYADIDHPMTAFFSFGRSDPYPVPPSIAFKGGSIAHIMKYGHRDGLKETVIATVMRDVLCALKYIHQQGGIHRDVKV